MLAPILRARRRERPKLRGQVKFRPERAKDFRTSLAGKREQFDALAIGAKARASLQDARKLVIR